MAWSREASLYTLLVIDSAFFFVEIITGYAVGSLALVADSFHMLNDVCSLIVALYAIKLANRETASASYSYGWQRAEILGALVNGVFLLALCFSIFMEAIERFVNGVDVRNPKLVVIVGSLGLLSNFVGLFLFHDHGHAHGGGGHSHGSHSHKRGPIALPEDRAAEEGRLPTPQGNEIEEYGEEGGHELETDAAEDFLYVHPAQARANLVRAVHEGGFGHANSPSSKPRRRSNSLSQSMKGGSKRSQSPTPHPNGHLDDSQNTINPKSYADALKKDAPKTAKLIDVDEHEHEDDHGHNHGAHGKQNGHIHGEHSHAGEDGHSHDEVEEHGGHSHGSMNMRGVFLHVMGDALGNVGVIAAGLLIWLTTWQYRFYFDPAISIVITIIIFSSAMPLVRSASFILLQGTPSNVSLEEVRGQILRIPGVEDVHDLHVWSLSESKVIGSVHVLVKSSKEYIEVSARIREVLHHCGIHSSTIQPEMIGELKPKPNASGDSPPLEAISEEQFQQAQRSSACLVQCVGANCADKNCCGDKRGTDA